MLGILQVKLDFGTGFFFKFLKLLMFDCSVSEQCLPCMFKSV